MPSLCSGVITPRLPVWEREVIDFVPVVLIDHREGIGPIETRDSLLEREGRDALRRVAVGAIDDAVSAKPERRVIHQRRRERASAALLDHGAGSGRECAGCGAGVDEWLNRLLAEYPEFRVHAHE